MFPNVQPRQDPEFLSPPAFNDFMFLSPFTPDRVIRNSDYKYSCNFTYPPNSLETPHAQDQIILNPIMLLY